MSVKLYYSVLSTISEEKQNAQWSCNFSSCFFFQWLKDSAGESKVTSSSHTPTAVFSSFLAICLLSMYKALKPQQKKKEKIIASNSCFCWLKAKYASKCSHTSDNML